MGKVRKFFFGRWESCGRDGCGEEDGGSRVRRWRHLKACRHQGLWNGKLNAVTLFGSRSELCPFCCCCPLAFVHVSIIILYEPFCCLINHTCSVAMVPFVSNRKKQVLPYLVCINVHVFQLCKCNPINSQSSPTHRTNSPATPIYSSPATPIYSSPATPIYSSPATPIYPYPATPIYSSHATPIYPSPATPIYSSPATPIYSSPDTPIYSSLPHPSTPPQPHCSVFKVPSEHHKLAPIQGHRFPYSQLTQTVQWLIKKRNTKYRMG